MIHSESKLALVFEYLDMDLKRYMDVAGERKIAAVEAAGQTVNRSTSYQHRALTSDLVVVSICLVS